MPIPDYDITGSLGPGSRFAGYVIERILGQGGAGIVYLARDEALDRYIALKVLHFSGISEDAQSEERFRTEAILAAKLEHPAIIPIYAAGIERGMTYLAMRYVPGRSLADLLDIKAPLAADDAIRLLRPIAAALDYAADHNIVHRDVKPANIFIDESVEPPRVLLGDFGIARAYEGTRHTATGGWVGTPEYIAPEVLKDDDATTAADQYSLACVLVECLSGVALFRRSNTAATLTAQVTELPDLTPISSLGTQAVDAIAVSLEKNPADRYARCTELFDVVQQCLRHDSKATPNTILRKRKRSKFTRRAKIIGGTAISLVAIALGLADLQNVKSSLFGTAPNIVFTSATPTTTTSTTDVLILGSDLPTISRYWVYERGMNASSAIVAALAQYGPTTDLRVKTMPLRKATACDSSLQEAISNPPAVAIVVLGSACQTSIARGLRAHPERIPPTYYLVNLSSGEQTFLAMAPTALFGRSPKVEIAIKKQFGGSSAGRIAIMPPIFATVGMYESGVFSRRLGLTHCVTLQVEPPDGAATSQPLNKAYLQAGRGPSDSVETIPLPLTRHGKQIGTLAEDRAIIKAVRDQKADCIVVPNIMGVEKWLVHGANAILKELPTVKMFIPSYFRLSLNLSDPAMFKRVYLVESLPYLMPKAFDQFRSSITETFGTTTNTLNEMQLFTDAAYLYLAVMLIGATKHATDPAHVVMPTIPIGEWTSGEDGTTVGGSLYSIQAQDVVYNKSTGLYSWYVTGISSLSPRTKDIDKTWLYIGGRAVPLDLPEHIMDQ